MTRRVVFAGGTQARALAKAYRLDIAGDSDEDVFFIGTEALAREAAHRVIAAADIVITELTATGETVPDHLIPPSAERIAVPVVRAEFLWPYAGAPHPQNKGTDALKSGPYPADFGDLFLDGMLAERVGPDEAIRRYLALDIAAEAGLNDLLDATLAALSALDARSGFDLAGYVAEEFRRQNLFATTERLRLPLFRHIAAGVFTRMGVAGMRAEALMEAPFAAGAMPIHPGVLRHFGMAAPLPDHRYPVLDEGAFTFEQYCRRYMRYEWNERLHTAMKLAESNPEEAIPLLRQALDVSPGSRAGQQALEDAERALAESAAVPPLVLPSAAGAAEPPVAPEAPIYAPVDEALPDNRTTARLMPGSLPVQPAPVHPAEAEPPVFSPTSLGKLPFTPAHHADAGETGADDERHATFDPQNPDFIIAGGDDDLADQQPYVELPHFSSFRRSAGGAAGPIRAKPLRPAAAVFRADRSVAPHAAKHPRPGQCRGLAVLGNAGDNAAAAAAPRSAA